MQSLTLVLCLAALVVFQGGFFGLPVCVVGVVCSVVAGISYLRRPKTAGRIPLMPLLLVGLSLCYLWSALSAGASLTTLSETGAWAACAGFALLSSLLDRDGRGWTMRAVAWLGVATAVAGVLTFAGVISFEGDMVVDRLQFSFQYANAAAAWFAAVALLCLRAPDAKLRALAFVPLSCLVLTLSGGGLLAFALVLAASCVACARRDDWVVTSLMLAHVVVAVVLFVALRISAVGGLVLGAALIAASVYRADMLASAVEKANAKLLSAAMAAVLVVAAVVVALLMPVRVADALASLAERTYHIKDGLRLWLSSPLLGVGPDNWQYLYPYVQSAPYKTAVVHSSLVQTLVDCGAVGFALLGAACVLGIRALWRSAREGSDAWAGAALLAATFVVLHSLFEFDLQFASLSCLLALLLRDPSGPQLSLGKLRHEGLVMALASLLVCLPLCLGGTLCSAVTQAMARARQTENYEACASLYEGSGLARVDALAQDRYLEAEFMLGNYEAVAVGYSRAFAPSTESVLYAAMACANYGDLEQASAILADRLERTPYDTQLVESALRFREVFGVDASQESRFGAAVERSRQLIGDSGLQVL